MNQNGRPRRTPRPPDSITGAAKRYHACAYAFATTLGIPLAEALRDYHGPITAIYIEVCRGDLRVPSGVSLPPLGAPRTQANGQPEAPELDRAPLPPGEGEASAASTHEGDITLTRDVVGPGAGEAPVASTNGTGDAPLPTRIPTGDGWPCAGHEISQLKPAQLHLLVSRAGFRAHADTTIMPLLAALQVERAQRLERGKRRHGEG